MQSRRIVGFALLILVAVTIALSWWTVERGRRLAEALSSAASALERAPDQPMEALAMAHRHLMVAQAELEALRPVVQPVAMFATAFQDLPWVGRPALHAAAAWSFVDAATTTAVEAVAAAEITRQSVGRDRGAAALVVQAPAIAGHLAAADAALQQARHARATLGAPDWPLDRLSAQVARWDALDARLGTRLGDAAAIASVLPAVLGEDRPVTFLVLVQTPDDLRATGGFITSIGSVQIADGRVRSASFEKVFAAEGIDVPSPSDAGGLAVQPPVPLMRYMGLGVWRLRDANWWASYPATARQAADFWEAHKGEKVDGVIAITESFLHGILRAVGPVELDDGQTVRAENVKTLTLSEVFKGDGPSQWYANQTGYSQALATALIDASQRLPPERLPALAHELQEMIDRRDLLFASFDHRIAGAMRPLRIDGALGGRRDDYLYVVEQNVSYGKLSPFVHQSLNYTVQLDATARPVLSRLTIDVENRYAPGMGLPGYPDDYYWGWWWNPDKQDLDGEEGFYGGYTRIFTPHGGIILGASGFDDGAGVASESGRPYVGGYLALKQGARRRIQAEWVPGAAMSERGRYRLLVQRQPGAASHDVTVRVELPYGYAPREVSGNARLEDGTVTWRDVLDRDLVFELTVEPSSEATALRR